MKKVIFVSVLASLTAVTGTAAFAFNTGTSGAACYERVQSSCSTASIPGACSEAGMNACDEIQAADLQIDALEIKIRKFGNRYKASYPGQVRRLNTGGNGEGNSSPFDASPEEPDVPNDEPFDAVPANPGPSDLQY